MKVLSALDRYPVPSTKGTVLGGAISVLGLLMLIVYLIVYYVIAFQSEFPTEAKIDLFPQKNSPPPYHYLPTLRCLQDSGCWYRLQIPTQYADSAPPAGWVPPCYYVPKDGLVPSSGLRVAHDSDPIDSFTAAWIGEDKVGFSYEVTSVNSYGFSLGTETIPAMKSTEMFLPPGVPDPNAGEPRYLLFSGLSMFSLVTTTSPSSDNVVNTWSNTVISEDSTISASSFVCCMPGASSNTFDTVSGSITSDPSKILASKCATETNVKQLKLRVYPTYVNVSVLSPFSLASVLAIAGGALAIIDFAVGGISRKVVENRNMEERVNESLAKGRMEELELYQETLGKEGDRLTPKGGNQVFKIGDEIETMRSSDSPTPGRVMSGGSSDQDMDL